MLRAKISKHIWGVTAIAVGITLRLILFLWNDSLFRDEAKLLLNIVNRNFAELGGMLDYGQMAPLPFLWGLRLQYLMGARSDLPFRAIPLTASILSLILFYCLAYKTIRNKYGIIISTWLLAVAHNQILYSCLVKQYSLDILISITLIFLSYPVLSKQLNCKRTLYFASFCSLSIWLSHPSIFIVGGVSLGLIINHYNRNLRNLAFFLGIISLSFTIQYIFLLKNNTSPYVLDFWENDFAPHAFTLWYAKALLEPIDAILGRIRYLQPLVGITCIIGLVHITTRKEGGWNSVLIFPLILALIASYFHKYPFSGRFLLYNTPGLLLLFGYGITGISNLVKKRFWPIFLFTALVVPYALISCITFGRPCGGVRESINYVADNIKAGDIILVDLFSAPVFKFYGRLTPRFESSANKIIFEWTDESTVKYAPSPKALLSSISGDSNIWFIGEASGQPRRFEIGFLRKKVREINDLLKEDRNLLDTHLVDRSFVLHYSPRKM